MAKLIEPPGTEIPTEDDVRLARESGTLLARHLESGHNLRVQFPDNGKPGEELVLPEQVGRLLLDAGSSVEWEPTEEPVESILEILAAWRRRGAGGSA